MSGSGSVAKDEDLISEDMLEIFQNIMGIWCASHVLRVISTGQVKDEGFMLMFQFPGSTGICQ